MLNSINSPADLKKINKKDLSILCEEIRKKIIATMEKNGGHLASNLGVVELTAAIHYVFNSPIDKIIFDVGHQSYTHKLLTGRNKEFDSIRKKNGLSGFQRKKESAHDPVDTGHSSTSISSGVGFAIANKLQNINSHVIVVVGDGALTGGVSFEGMNFTGHLEVPIFVILNDNDMAIDKNVGALSNFLNKVAVSRLYQRFIDFLDNRLKKTSGIIKAILRFLNNLKRGFKFLVEYENVFTSLGFEYIGPINGHDINELIYIFDRAKRNIHHPVLFHVKTIKGKGYAMAEGNPAIYHGVTPNLMAGIKFELNENNERNESRTFTDAFSEKIVEMGRNHKDIVAITAAMEIGTGLTSFRNEFSDRFFDVGIAEQHAVSFAAALAYNGLRPVLAVYSTFLLRGLDQLVQDVCISKAPIIFAIDRAGIVGADGETHQGQFDISYLKMLPNITVMAPCDENELNLMLDYAYALNSPAAVRYPRSPALQSQLDDFHPPMEQNHFVNLEEGKDLLIIVVGPFVKTAHEIVNELNYNSFNIGLIYLRILKPINEELLLKEISGYKSILIIEENVFSGSVSQEISSMIANNNLNLFFSSINLPDSFIEQSTRNEILTDLGFDLKGIKQKVYEILNKVKKTSQLV